MILYNRNIFEYVEIAVTGGNSLIPDIEDHSNSSVFSRKNLIEICNIILSPPPIDLAHVYFWRALESIEGTEGKSQYLPKQVKKVR